MSPGFLSASNVMGNGTLERKIQLRIERKINQKYRLREASVLHGWTHAQKIAGVESVHQSSGSRIMKQETSLPVVGNTVLLVEGGGEVDDDGLLVTPALRPLGV